MSFTAGDEFDYPAGGSEEFGDEDDDEEDFMHTGGEAAAAILFSSYLGFLSETMLNLPDSLYPDPIQGDNSVMSNGGAPANNNGPCDGASKAIDWPSASVEDLKQGRIQDLALHIWRSISTVFLLLSEVLSIYKSLTPEKLTMKDSSKVCDVLVLFECLATHPQTKMQFLNVQIHCYLYPFLETEETSKPFQYLRLMSLGVIGGLLKEVGDPSTKVAVHCLLESGLFPLCLKSIEYGNELSQS
ncbi:cell differentiation protein rcd1-like, partial [Apium graveolens]|uniref:cell differentiation protein rcd1-like n=2 Tax=Apium graveolens TaxID=4045 RepID=UPI003D7A4BC4